jgi:heterodisulfide reductase subunit A-like polyferredoxin
VVHTQVLPFSCSHEAADTISAAVEANHLEKAVLAACSCCSVNQVCFSCTFQRVRCKQNLGLFTYDDKSVTGNPPPARSARFEFVNIREQCAWVHADDPQAATAKAITMIAVTVAKLRAEVGRKVAGLPQQKTTLILGKGAAAASCKKALDKQNITATILKGLPEQVERAGGQFTARVNGQTWQASTLVLAPRDAQEAEELLAAFGREALRPRVNSAWDSVETHRPGIFHCDINRDAALTGAAAAARVNAWLTRTQTRPPFAASVDPARCRACGTCVETCEFGAPALTAFEQDRVASWIDPVICTGCGTCAARCPSGAITAGYASDKELQVMLNAIMS